MKKLSTKLSLLLVVTSLIPLFLFGIFSIIPFVRSAKTDIIENNMHVALIVSQQVEDFIQRSSQLLETLAQTISKSHLNKWQKKILINAYFLNFPQFQRIMLVNKEGKVIIDSSIISSKIDLSKRKEFLDIMHGKKFFLSNKVEISHMVPTISLAAPVKELGKVSGILWARINLTRLWRMIDQIKAGKSGYSMVLDKKGNLIATGETGYKAEVLIQINLKKSKLVDEIIRSGRGAKEYINRHGEKVLGVGLIIPSLNWISIIEQPSKEAFAQKQSLLFYLIGLMGTFIMIMAIAGSFLGKIFLIKPIENIMHGIDKISKGEFHYKVKEIGKDELAELAKKVNQMGDKLFELTEDIKEKERAAYFGRIAQGLAHDLKHPVLNIENASRLLKEDFGDPKRQSFFEKITFIELKNIRKFLDDLYDLTRAKIVILKEVELNEIVDYTLESMREKIFQANIIIDKRLESGPLLVKGDATAIQRVIKNIVTNGIEAMQEGGLLKVITKKEANFAKLIIEDSGEGITKDQIKKIFLPLFTTKGKGLGIGLAITKRLIKEMGGKIIIESEEGKGTRVLINFILFKNGE